MPLASQPSPDSQPFRVPLHILTPERFAPFGQVLEPRASKGQFILPEHNPGTSPDELQLTLGNGIPRLWIMHLTDVRPPFAGMARHKQVTQCLGSLGGTEWLFAVAAPGAAPELGDIVGFRIPGDRIVKLHLGTWHAGPHFTAPEAMFLNLENMNTRREDFEEVELSAPCVYATE